MSYSYSDNLQSHNGSARQGAIAPLAAISMSIVMMMAAFAVDMGLIMVAKADLQRAADAAAQSAVLDYRNDGSLVTVLTSVRESARTATESNPVLNTIASVNLNRFNANSNGDVLLGRIDFENPRDQMTSDSPGQYNAVTVRVRRTLDKNGSVPLFFGRIFGMQGLELEARATAALIKNVGGFRIPSSGENVPLLPITVSTTYWDFMSQHDIHDEWSYDAENQVVKNAPDDKPEIVLFPNETAAPPDLIFVKWGFVDAVRAPKI